MRILGLAFAGTSTRDREQMVAFLRETLSLPGVRVDGVEADLFELPDGSSFAVAGPGGMGETSRSIEFLVDQQLYELVERKQSPATGQVPVRDC